MVQGGGGGGPTFEYYALDALGSVRVVFDATGAIKARADYEPFGSPIPSSTTGPLPREQFTGQQRDSEVGLDYFGARFYHATHGRMLSVDPLYMGAVGDPQRWNRYAHVLNSPLNALDPDGRQTFYTRTIENCGGTCFPSGGGDGSGGASSNTGGEHVLLPDSRVGCGQSAKGCQHPGPRTGEPAVQDSASAAPAEREPDFRVTVEDKLEEILPVIADGAAGFGDALTFDMTSWVRRRFGWDAVRYDSWSYTTGELGGLLVGVAVGRATWQPNVLGFELSSAKDLPTLWRLADWRVGWHRIPTGAHAGRWLPHYHRRPGIGKHRPWEGGW
jgi:RHS repeat-associated protein